MLFGGWNWKSFRMLRAHVAFEENKWGIVTKKNELELIEEEREVGAFGNSEALA